MNPADLAELPGLVRDAPAESLPQILGVLEEAKGLAWARLTAPPPASQVTAPDENLGAEEAARRLGVSKSWLYKNTCQLPFAVRIGRRLLFSARGLERWNRHRLGAP